MLKWCIFNNIFILPLANLHSHDSPVSGFSWGQVQSSLEICKCPNFIKHSPVLSNSHSSKLSQLSHKSFPASPTPSTILGCDLLLQSGCSENFFNSANCLIIHSSARVKPFDIFLPSLRKTNPSSWDIAFCCLCDYWGEEFL